MSAELGYFTMTAKLQQHILDMAEEQGMQNPSFAVSSDEEHPIVVVDLEDESYHFEISLKKIKTS